MTQLARTAISFSLFALLACPCALAIDLEVTRLDGQLIRGRLVQLTPEIIIASADEDATLTWSEVLALRPLGVDEPSVSLTRDDPLRFELADGSVFGARIDSATDRGFTVRFQSGQTCRLTPSMLRAVHSTTASEIARAELVQIAAEPSRSEDVAVLERDSRVIVLRGVVRRIDSRYVLFAWKDRERPLPWERIAGLRLARPTPRRSSCTVHLHGGEVFGGRVIGGDEVTVTLQSSVFDGLRLPWSRIERIECRSERLTFLSDLVPLRYDFTPFFQKRWNYARDRTLMGRPIRLAGRHYAKGVTMHSRASLVYALRGQYRQFAATAGVVDEMGGRGDVTLAVVGDGRVLWEAANVRGGEEPREVLVDVTGVRELSLHVDFGEGLDLSDHACWALARLIR
ncbi:MAG: NPCBM/NEW2 domain-containing protein [Phycisphaerae bacterium]